MIGRPGCGILQMNGQPTAQNTRECGADGDLPGFRNWDNPAHVEQLADALERRPDDHPALGAADARDADLPLRRAGLDQAPLDHRHQPGRVAARVGAHPQDPRRQESLLRGRPGRLPDRDRRSSPTSSCPPRSGARRPAPSPTSTAPSTSRTRPSSRRARPEPTSTSSSTYARRMDFRTRTATRSITVARPRGGLRGLEGVLARAALRLHRADLRQAARPQRHPVAVHRRGTRTAPSASTPTGVFNTDPDYCETYGHDLAHRRGR